MGYERYGRRDNRFDRDPRDRDPRYGRDSYGYRERSEYGRGDYGRPPRDYDYDDRGFFDRAGDEVRSWFGDEEAERRRRWDERIQQREYERQYGPAAMPPRRAAMRVRAPAIPAAMMPATRLMMRASACRAIRTA